MDETALERYGFFSKLGLFPVELNTPRGAMQFLRSATEILSTPNSVLWLTPQGHFADPRPRPLEFKDGLASLLSRLPKAAVVPLAIEYVYWDERLPEILVNPGIPIRNDGGARSSASEWSAVLTSGLAAAQDELAALAITRNPQKFEPILEGGPRVSGCSTTCGVEFERGRGAKSTKRNMGASIAHDLLSFH